MLTERKCTICKVVKEIGLFPKDRANKSGVSYTCKPCCKVQNKRFKENNPEYHKLIKRKPEYRAVSKKYKLNWDLKQYGLTPDSFNDILLKQNERCSICNSTTAFSNGRWHIDHDHKTGIFRSLLCSKCNTGLGRFKETPANFYAAAKYLESEEFIPRDLGLDASLVKEIFKTNKTKHWNLKAAHGVSLAWYQKVFDKQCGLCAICDLASDKPFLHVDHCHKTNHIRGLLCENCNLGLGLFSDSPNLLRAAAAYVVFHSLWPNSFVIKNHKSAQPDKPNDGFLKIA